MRQHPLYQLTLAKLRDLLREPEAVFWVFVFPILLTVALGFAFRAGEPEPIIAGVMEGPGAERLVAEIAASGEIETRLLPAGEAREQLRRGDVSVVVIPAGAEAASTKAREGSEPARGLERAEKSTNQLGPGLYAGAALDGDESAETAEDARETGLERAEDRSSSVGPGLYAGAALDGDEQAAPVAGPKEALTYWFDPTRPESRVARLAVDDALQRAAGRADPLATSARTLDERGSRYIDFLVPGLIGMNLMGTGMWGIGFYIVNARSKKLLKRLVAAPMRRSHFLASQIIARLVFLVLEVGVLASFAVLVFDVPLRGSFFTFALVCIFGGVVFAGLGLLVAARPKTIEGVSGLMNFVMLPMWIGSGVFFSTERFPEVAQPFLQALPLTAIIDALRAVMLDGAGLVDIAGELAIAGAWGVASFAVALLVFRWS